ncbi:unnamed protein product [Cochlearia groenlandica]
MDRDELETPMNFKKQKTGDISNPEDEGSPKVLETQPATTVKFYADDLYKLYVKVSVSKETDDESGKKKVMGGLGVAICDYNTDKVLYEMKEPVTYESIDSKGVEIKAMIRGLTESFDLGITRIVVHCEDSQIYENITGNYSDPRVGVIKITEEGVIKLIEELEEVRKKFAYCRVGRVHPTGNKIASKLAREAIVSRNDDDEDDGDDGHDGHDGHDDDDWYDNPANGCGCDFDVDSPPTVDYVDYYTL